MIDPLPTLESLSTDPALALGLTADDAARLLARVEGVAAVLRATIRAGRKEPDPPPTQSQDHLLTPEQAAKRLGLTVK